MHSCMIKKSSEYCDIYYFLTQLFKCFLKLSLFFFVLLLIEIFTIFVCVCVCVCFNLRKSQTECDEAFLPNFRLKFEHLCFSQCVQRMFVCLKKDIWAFGSKAWNLSSSIVFSEILLAVWHYWCTELVLVNSDPKTRTLSEIWREDFSGNLQDT